ncbi:RNA polymerase sigma factor [Streptomyces sp. NPDC058451]|uniref:RNA polymerase sigma factor n=1 Tax=Streptomyces sp. NPDC058451 TaxID=3346506 RepID=UPI0036462A67
MLFRLRVDEDPDALGGVSRLAVEDDLARAGEDAALYAALAAAEFQGMAWDVCANALAAYAHPIIMNWLYTGEIFRLCRQQCRPVRRRTAQDMQALRADSDEREGLVCEAIARGLKVFHKHALIDGGWRPGGQASLKTYFVGAVVREFAGVFDRWASERSRQPPCDPDGLEELRNVAASPGDTPETQVIGHDVVQRLLAQVKDDTTRTALFLSMRGYTMKEIGEHLHLTAGALTMRLSRLRKNPPRQQGGPLNEPAPTTVRNGEEDA